MMKIKYNIGDIIKVPNEEDYGFVAQENETHYWIHWFLPYHKDLYDHKDENENQLYKYSKREDQDFEVVKQ